MSAINDFHHEAMDFAALAFMERARGNAEKAIGFFEQALEYEVAAIDALDEYVEPTYSVLHRSAATLALDCKLYRKAEQLAARALAQEPPGEIAEELRDVLEQANFSRHLEVKGLTLAEDELQISLSGQGVGLGIIGYDDFTRRIDNSSKLVYRIAERRQNREFRRGGSPPKEIKDAFQPLISVPRAASFAVTMKFGQRAGQMYLPLDLSETVDEFMDVMEFVDSSRISDLQALVPELPYLRNFIGLAKGIAPDGERVQQVGFTLLRKGVERAVSFTKIASELAPPPVGDMPAPQSEPVELNGILRFADAIGGTEDQIKIIDGNITHSVIVPEGMMNDIVRPMWDSVVVVSGVRTGNRIELQDIWAADTD